MRCFTRNTITVRVFNTNEDRRDVNVAGCTRIHVFLAKHLDAARKHLDAVGAAMAADLAGALQRAAAAAGLARPWVGAIPVLIPAFAIQSKSMCYRSMSRSWQESQMLSGSERPGVLQRS